MTVPRKKMVHILLSVITGLGLATYLLVSAHNQALKLSIDRQHFAHILKWRIVGYCLAGVIIAFLALALTTYLAGKRRKTEISGYTIQAGFYPWILLFLSVLQLKYPFLEPCLRLLFILVMGTTIAYLAYYLAPDLQISKPRARLFLYLGIAVYILFFSLFSIQRHGLFMTHALDLGVFTQTLWGYSKGEHLINTVVFAPMYLLGDHWTPIAFLFVPFYWIWSDPRMLLIIQSICLGMSAIPLYLLAQRESENTTLSLAIALAFLLFPGLHGVNLSDFHYISIATLFLCFLFYLDKTGKRIGFYSILVLLLLVREDMSYHLFFFGLYLFICRRKWKRGAVIMSASVVWFYLVMNFFLPMYNTENPRFHMEIYSHLGNTVPEIIHTIMVHPLDVIDSLTTDGIKRIEYLLHLSVPTGFGFLGSWQTLFIVVPSMAFNLLSNFRGQYTIKGQYNAPVIPFLFFAVILGIMKTVNRFSQGNLKKKQAYMCSVSVYLIVSGVLSVYYFSPTPLAKDIHFTEYRLTRHDHITRQILQKIPDDSAVSAQSDLVPHLSNRKEIYVFPFGWQESDYVILDLYSTCFPVPDSEYRRQVKKVFRDPGLGVLEFSDGTLLFKRDYTNEKNETAFRLYRPLINHPRLPDGRVDMPKGSYVIPFKPVK